MTEILLNKELVIENLYNGTLNGVLTRKNQTINKKTIDGLTHWEYENGCIAHTEDYIAELMAEDKIIAAW